MPRKLGYSNLLEDIESEFAESLRKAAASGLSVLEIAAITGRRKALLIYRLFQKNRLIGNGVRKSRHRGPDFLEKVLEATGLSFAMWCNCWGFDPAVADRELKSDPTLPGAKRYHEAVRRDFAFAYVGERPRDIGLDQWEREICSRKRGYSYHLDWDEEWEEYIGTVPEIPSLHIVGKYPSDLLMILIRGVWLKKNIDTINIEICRRKNNK